MNTPEAPDAAHKAELRHWPRSHCDFAITMHWGSAVLDGRVVDISADGMFVETDKPLWMGASFTAQLALEPPVKIECVVRRVEPFRGMALSYSIAGDAGRKSVAAALDQLGRA